MKYNTVTHKEPIIIAVSSGGGGVGKSCSTAYLSIALAKITGKRVLCANVNVADHALKLLGIKKVGYSNVEKNTPHISDYGVDVLTYDSIWNIQNRKSSILGTSNLKVILQQIPDFNDYKYIVCDSGRGCDEALEKQSLCLADIVVIPIRNSLHDMHGAETVYELEKRMALAEQNQESFKTKKVYFFYNRGAKQLKKKYQKIMDDSLSSLINKFKENLNINASILQSVVPETTRFVKCVFDEEQLFSNLKVKDIADAYLLAASEIELDMKNQFVQSILENKEDLRSKENHFDVFISHASEDKDDFVRPFAELLRDQGLKVWYDEFELKIGDSLRQHIDKGLINSRYGIVILSKAFLEKSWTNYELNSLVAKEIEGKKVILPIWHNISKDDVLRYSPMLADKFALSSGSKKIEEMVKDFYEILKE